MRVGFWARLAVAMALAIATTTSGCGGRTAVIGLGNSGNRIIEDGLLGQVADALAQHPGTPVVSDDTLAGIFAAIQRRAESGEPEAALIVLMVAEAQRKEKPAG